MRTVRICCLHLLVTYLVQGVSVGTLSRSTAVAAARVVGHAVVCAATAAGVVVGVLAGSVAGWLLVVVAVVALPGRVRQVGEGWGALQQAHQIDEMAAKTGVDSSWNVNVDLDAARRIAASSPGSRWEMRDLPDGRCELLADGEGVAVCNTQQQALFLAAVVTSYGPLVAALADDRR